MATNDTATDTTTSKNGRRSADDELKAISTMVRTLEALSENSRRRAMLYCCDRFAKPRAHSFPVIQAKLKIDGDALTALPEVLTKGVPADDVPAVSDDSATTTA